MDPLLIVSPHLDDAVLSCGQLMAGRSDCVVVTVFAGTPDRHRQLTTYDQACGFTSAAQAVTVRRDEDAAAVVRLGGGVRHLGFVDHQYREVDTGPPVDPWEIAEQLARTVDEIGARVVFGPLGLAHVDHVHASEAFRLLVTQLRRQVEPWLYEDMPSRVLWPEEVPGRLGWWGDVGFSVEKGFAGTGPLADKEEAIGCYRSQTGPLLTACEGTLYPVLVPERHHRLWRSDP